MAKNPHIGMIVIGQTPRVALAEELARYIPPILPVVQVGALDDLSRSEIDAAKPLSGTDTLFTTMPDGQCITVSKATVTKGIVRRLVELQAQGIAVALLCCSGAFPGLVSPIRFIEPDKVLMTRAAEIVPSGRVGLLFPLAEQGQQLARKYRRKGVETIGKAVAPGSSSAAFSAAAVALSAHDPDLIIMDCMGYTAADKANVQAVYDGSILLAMSAAARVLEQVSS